MRVTLLHQAVARDASEDEKDVLVQADSVAAALRRLGHDVRVVQATLDLRQTRDDLLAADPDRVFFMVESLGGTDSLAHLAAFLLDSMKLPYTGAPAASLVASNNKLRAKRWMAMAGLPTPGWFEPQRRPATPTVENGAPAGIRLPGTFILKPADEHASLGMTDDAVVEASDREQLGGMVVDRSAALGRACFAEQYIEGREFNLAILGSAEGPAVLPPAEIDFDSFPAGKPRIVGYDAKWTSGSFEFENTPRVFPFAAAGTESGLGDRLTDLALRCWEVFELRGSARVDFRVDGAGDPWILEVNANPCLSPDAGFAAALSQAGIPWDRAIATILEDTAPRPG